MDLATQFEARWRVSAIEEVVIEPLDAWCLHHEAVRGHAHTVPAGGMHRFGKPATTYESEF